MRLRSLAAAAAASAVFWLAAPAGADDASAPSYYRDVMPIFQQQCMTCHRPQGMNLGGIIAPMALTSYEETRPWAKSILKTVKERSMPPWHASEAFHGVFRNERVLNDAQIATIVHWVESGCPQGNAADAPPAMEWTKSEWSIGEPDLVVKFEKPFMVKDEVDDLNSVVSVRLTPEMLPEDKFITSMEFHPGSSIVHHILGFIRPPRETGEGLQMVGGIAPGSTPIHTVDGYGIKLHKGSVFIFQMHYNKEAGAGTAREDVSSVAFKFATKPVHRLYVEAIGDPKRLYIPAGAADEKVMSRRKWDRDVIVAGYLPHMHLRGVYSKYDAVFPDGKRETLLETPKWNFNWQMSYEYPEPRKMPAGTIIETTMGYNNSDTNPGNPNPKAELTFGEETTDEMNLAWITWGYAEPTDHDPVPRAIGGGNDDLPALTGGPPAGVGRARVFPNGG